MPDSPYSFFPMPPQPRQPASTPQTPGSHDTRSLRDLDHHYLWHPFTHMRQWLAEDPLVITDAEGMYLIDSDGNRYLDGVSSLWCNIHGHRVMEIDMALRWQLGRVAHTTMLGLANEPAILLAEKLIRIAPKGLAKVFYSDAGATAAEIAFKMAVQYWHNLGQSARTEFVAFKGAYHGDTIGAISVGRIPEFHEPYFPLLFKVHSSPLDLNALDTLLKQHDEKIAAVCIEPIVQGAGGMILQPPGFLRGVWEICNRHGVLMIADEVATGFGRTGKMFACEHENVCPDLMCVGKGITAGYLPLAATLTTQKIFEAFLGETWENKTFFHGHTYTGNPLACAAALASLKLFETGNLLESVEQKSVQLGHLLQQLRPLRHVSDVRHKGFMAAIELVADKNRNKPFDPKLRTGAAVCARVRQHGVILRPLGDVIVIMPPLAMGIDDIEKIITAVYKEIAAIVPS